MSITGVGLDANYTTTCPFGRYKTKFPPRYLPSACYEQQTGPAGTAILTMLDALEEVGGLKMHLGLAYTFEATFGLADFARYTALQKEVAAGIWSIIPEAHRALVGGVYAMTEPHNGHYPWDTEVEQISAYFNGLAAFVKSTLRSDLLVWDSPYITGNTTGDEDAKQGHVMNVSDTAAWWSKVWKLAPSFDLIAVQDHLGQAYMSSFHNVSEYFLAVAATSPLAAAECGRTLSSSARARARTVPAHTTATTAPQRARPNSRSSRAWDEADRVGVDGLPVAKLRARRSIPRSLRRVQGLHRRGRCGSVREEGHACSCRP